jgi:hypothetical protein
VTVDAAAFGGVQRAHTYRQVLDLVIGKEVCFAAFGVTPPVFGRDISYPLHVFGIHCLTSDVGRTQKLTIFIDLAQTRPKVPLGAGDPVSAA